MSRKPVKPTAVLFDWDNTLVNTWPVIHKALHETFQYMGHTPWTLEETKDRVGKSMRDAFPALFNERWQEAADYYRSQYRSIHLQKLTPLPDAEEVLKDLKRLKVPIGLVSNKMGDTLRMEVSHLGWGEYFGAVIGAHDAEHDKPHAAPLLLAMEQMSVPADMNVLFVGDSEVDLEASKAAGVRSHLYGDHMTDAKIYRGFSFDEHHRDHALFRQYIAAISDDG